MLKQLYIKNFTLIDELDVDFSTGFSVITGETGAGKSIILGALGLLLGNRADVKAIKAGENRCVIEGHFDLSAYDMEGFFEQNDIDFSADDCIIRREVNSNGKSRSFVNDTPASLALVKELGEQLIDIHSQHQNLLLQKDDFQLSVVDTIAGNNNLLAEYRQKYSLYSELERELQLASEQIEIYSKNIDIYRYQFDELQCLKLTDGEQEKLEQLSNAMQHSEDLKTSLYEASMQLDEEESGVLRRLHRTVATLNSVAHIYPQAAEMAERIEQSYIELKDASGDIESMVEEIEYDPNKLAEINSRLDAIYSLQSKHHVKSVAELIEVQQQLEQKLDSIDNSEEKLQKISKEVERAKKEIAALAQQLTLSRNKAAKTIEADIAERLKPLGLPNVRFEVQIKPKDYTRDGADRATFLFSANPGTPLHAISQVASGGEIARVMLALKAMLSGTVKLPTIIFDEIDTGVSGRIAEQMATLMQEMGKANRQVISITHLPQIAAMGSSHYKVYKEQGDTTTSTHMKRLTNDERITEIAQMLSGSNITQAAITNAKELLKANNI